MGGDGVDARSGVCSLDLGGRVFPDDLTSSVAGVPNIGKRVLGTEVVDYDGCRDGFTHYNFIRLHGTGGTTDGTGGMHPLISTISNKPVPLGIRVALRKCTTRNERYGQTYQHAYNYAALI